MARKPLDLMQPLRRLLRKRLRSPSCRTSPGSKAAGVETGARESPSRSGPRRKAGMMLGDFRLIENDKVLVIELFTLVEKPGGINFYFRHFTPELVPWEKSDATVLQLASAEREKI